MGLWGVIPELGRRGVELHLCAVHAEWSDAERKWCWDSMGIWAVGPLPNPGTAMSIADHALTALHHPRMIDSTPKQLHKGYPKESYDYSAPDPERFVRLDMDTEFELVDSQCINHPKGVALAGDIPVRPWKPVRAHQDRFSAVYNMPVHEKEPIAEQVWRCPGPGPFTITDMMEPLPPMNEVMADCTRWDPLGHRWGRGAHWPLVLGIGHRRDRTPAQRQNRNQTQYQKRAEQKAKASALAEGFSLASAWNEGEHAKGKGQGGRGRTAGKGWNEYYAWSSSNAWQTSGTSSGSWQDSSPWHTSGWR
jgi:hypothetical protein